MNKRGQWIAGIRRKLYSSVAAFPLLDFNFLSADFDVIL